MATLQAVTVASPARITDEQAVEDLCGMFYFGNLNRQLDEDGLFHVWGYDSFDVWPRNGNEEPTYDEPATVEFLFALAEYIAEGEEFDIQMVGFEKCRYPVLAARYVVRPGEVLYTDLRQHLDFVTPPDEETEVDDTSRSSLEDSPESVQ